MSRNKMTERETVFDPLRKKRVPLTPEEDVRQRFIIWMHEKKGYPLSLMASEYSVKYNSRDFRCDIVCFTRDMAPGIIIECKAPEIRINGKVADQIARYNMILKVKYLIITNGVVTFAAKYDESGGKYVFIKSIPDYKELDDGNTGSKK
jgi:hypothetical protein